MNTKLKNSSVVNYTEIDSELNQYDFVKLKAHSDTQGYKEFFGILIRNNPEIVIIRPLDSPIYKSYRISTSSEFHLWHSIEIVKIEINSVINNGKKDITTDIFSMRDFVITDNNEKHPK